MSFSSLQGFAPLKVKDVISYMFQKFLHEFSCMKDLGWFGSDFDV